MKTFRTCICAMLVSVAFYGCGGGGGGGGTTTSGSSVLPAGKNILAFSAYSTAKLAAPISGIDLTFKLPMGISVATATGASGAIVTESVLPGTGMTGTNLAYGNYSASTRKVYLSMATTSDKYRSGEFIRLVCTVSPGTNITLSELRTLNNPVAIKKAVGFDTTANSTVVLTGSLDVLLDLAH